MRQHHLRPLKSILRRFASSSTENGSFTCRAFGMSTGSAVAGRPSFPLIIVHALARLLRATCSRSATYPSKQPHDNRTLRRPPPGPLRDVLVPGPLIAGPMRPAASPQVTLVLHRLTVFCTNSDGINSRKRGKRFLSSTLFEPAHVVGRAFDAYEVVRAIISVSRRTYA
jgi:hypothetical protein